MARDGWRLAHGGGRGIRTPGTLSGTTVFKTAGINHSPIPPQAPGWRCFLVYCIGNLARTPNLAQAARRPHSLGTPPIRRGAGSRAGESLLARRAASALR
jgi:hypothetical protein